MGLIEMALGLVELWAGWECGGRSVGGSGRIEGVLVISELLLKIKDEFRKKWKPKSKPKPKS